MIVSRLVLLPGLAALTIVYLLLRVRDFLHHRAKARSLGCKPPVRGLATEPSGIVEVIKGIRATREKRFLDWIQEKFERLSQKIGRPPGTALNRMPIFRDVFFTSDPQNIQAMLALQFKDFGLGISRTHNFKPLLGDGIFAANGKQWEHSRALLRPQFVRGQISDLALEEDHIQSLMRVLNLSLGSDGWTDFVDLQPLFFRLTLDSATEFLFGESVDSQLRGLVVEPGVEATLGIDFGSAFDASQAILAITARLGPHYWLGHTRQLNRVIQDVHKFVDYFVERALEHGDSEKPDTGTGANDDKGRYVFIRALAKDTKDPAELRWQLINILLAGRDTTASSLGWLLFTLAQEKNVDIFKQLRATILQEFGTWSAPRNITFETLKNCQYLQWCIHEALRLYPVVPINSRTAMIDTTLPTGGGPDGKSPIYVRKGQDVVYTVHTMHRRKDLWGPDANEFVPTRWKNRRPGWDYLPFNGGPRICIGQQFALTEMSYIVVRLLQRVDQIDGSRVGPVRHGLTITNCPGDGVNVRLHFAE